MSKRPPNLVVMFLDDSGWGDFRPFGKTPYPTPNVERLAARGVCFSRFYVPQAICSASRASLLTGCYPERHGVFAALGPRKRGLEPAFATLAEVLKPAGYATACFGKWHVGDEPDTRPPARGFDESAGLMVSNDMWRHHPQYRNFDSFDLQFWKNGELAIADVDHAQQKQLTTWYTEFAVDFIRRRKDGPFFLYVPHNMPHVPLAVSDKFEGKSGSGLYGDVMMEIDWSLGRILDALEEAGVADDTLVLFTSDNGPWLVYGDHAGTTPYREGKATSFDGGIRSACVASYPAGGLPQGVDSDRAFCSIDILPTVARLAGAALPANPIDGRDVWDWICGVPGAVQPHDYYAITRARFFEGVLSGDGRWKLHLPHEYHTVVEPGRGGKPGQARQETIGETLFDLERDPCETTDVAASHPGVVQHLLGLAEGHRKRWFERQEGIG